MKIISSDCKSMCRHCSTEQIMSMSRQNKLLLSVAERFLYHSTKAKSDKTIISEAARKMCEIEIWEMWTLTQEVPEATANSLIIL